MITPLTKPPRRGPKPKRPIKRSTAPLKRTSRPSPIRRTPKAAEKRQADREWSAAVKAKGPCAAKGKDIVGPWSFRFKDDLLGVDVNVTGSGPFRHECLGPIDPAHIFSRRFAATRHDPDNGMPLCRAAHDWFTQHSIAWELFCRETIGPEAHAALYAKAHGISESKGEQS